MTENEQKIIQYKKDIDALNKNLVELQKEKVKETKLVPGDVVKSEQGWLRLIVSDHSGKIFAVSNRDGVYLISEPAFATWGYKKIGKISDFIKKER